MNTVQSYYKICNFDLTMSSNATILSAVRDDCGRPLTTLRSIILVWLCASFAENTPVFAFSIFC